MMIVKFRSESDAKDTLKKLKKMHKFTKELIECLEDKLEDDYDEDYRDDDEYEHHRDMMETHHTPSYRGARYRRSM